MRPRRARRDPVSQGIKRIGSFLRITRYHERLAGADRSPPGSEVGLDRCADPAGGAAAVGACGQAGDR